MSEYMMKSGMKNGMQLNISIIDWKKVSPPKLVVQKRSKKKYLKKNILHSKMMNNPVNCLRIISKLTPLPLTLLSNCCAVVSVCSLKLWDGLEKGKNREKLTLDLSHQSLARPKFRSLYKTITNCAHCDKLHALNIWRSNHVMGSLGVLILELILRHFDLSWCFHYYISGFLLWSSNYIMKIVILQCLLLAIYYWIY